MHYLHMHPRNRSSYLKNNSRLFAVKIKLVMSGLIVIFLGICMIIGFTIHHSSTPTYSATKEAKNAFMKQSATARVTNREKEPDLRSEPIPTKRIPLSSVKVENVLHRITQVSSRFSGNKLAMEQVKLLGEISSGDELETSQLLDLVKVLHFAVADNYLPQAWTIVLTAAAGRPDFKISDLISDIPEGQLGRDILTSVGTAMAAVGRQPSERELGILKQEASIDQYRSFLSQFASINAVYDSSGALSFAIHHKADLGEDGLCGVILNLSSPEDYKYVADSTLLLNTAGSYDVDIVRSLASGWAASDPLAAADWVGAISDSKIRENAAKALVERWSSYDLQGAARWLASTNLQNLDSSIGVLVKRLTRYSPEDAKLWANQIKDEETRTRSLADIQQASDTSSK